MKKLEKLGLKPVADSQKDRLARWLFEWNLMQVSSDAGNDNTESSVPNELVSLDQMISGNTKAKFNPPMVQSNLGIKMTPSVMLAEQVSLMDSSIEVGQIRLMAPVADEDMVFVVVVFVALDGVVGCVPFSPLSEPATPDELLSGRSKEVVRVYCLWNMREVPHSVINKSWIVDRLDESEIERLLKSVHAYRCNGLLPDDLLHDAGPVLVHPEDPRREYRSWERQRIDMVLPSNCSVKESGVSYDIESEPLEFLKAAEPGEDYEV